MAEIVERLQRPASSPQSGRLTVTPNDRLISAAQRQDVIALLRALQDRADVNAADSGGVTALMFACDQQWVEGVELLLERGADVHVFDHLGYAALGHAEYNGERLKPEYEVRSRRILTLLRERGAPATVSEARQRRRKTE